LTGEQGVIIPSSNVQNLMLRKDVVDAVRKDQFHVYRVSTVEEGIEILTGVSAGRPDGEGRYLRGPFSERFRKIEDVYRPCPPGQAETRRSGGMIQEISR